MSPATEPAFGPVPERVVESVRRRPAPALQPSVAWYSGFRQVGCAPATHRGLPGPHLTFIVTFDDPLFVAAHPDPAAAPAHYGTRLGGLHTRPALVSHEGRQAGVQLAVHPLAARALFGIPAGELGSRDLEANTVVGAWADEVRERVGEATTWDERFAAIDAVLLRHLNPVPEPPGDVAHAWRRMVDAGGLPIRELADEVGWSGRYFGDRFRRETGVTLRQAGRVIRFGRAHRLLQARVATGQPYTLAEVAATCGFFDQAHLAREFRTLAGVAPSAWLTEEFANIQAMDTRGIAHWAS